MSEAGRHGDPLLEFASENDGTPAVADSPLTASNPDSSNVTSRCAE